MRVSDYEIDQALQGMNDATVAHYAEQASAAIARHLNQYPDYWKRFGPYCYEVARIMQRHGFSVPEAMAENHPEFILYKHSTDTRTMVAAILYGQQMAQAMQPDEPFAIETLEGTKLYQHGTGVLQVA